MLSLIISTLSIRMFAIFLRWGSSLNIIQNISITEAYTKSVFSSRAIKVNVEATFRVISRNQKNGVTYFLFFLKH